MIWDRLNIGSLHLDWGVVISLAVLALVAGMLIFLLRANRRSQVIFGLKVLFEINEYFHSDAMLATRRKAATALLNDSHDENVEELLDFFEMVGYLSRRCTIRKEFIWNHIAYFIIRYWYAAKVFIEKERQKNPTRWVNMTSLFQYLSKMERKKYGVSVITQGSIRGFLEKESGNTR